MNLSGFRDYKTDDGEEYWAVDPAHAIEALYGEMESWPEVRVLNPHNGEILQAPLRHLIGGIVRMLREGHSIRVEPLVGVPEKEREA